MSWWNRLLAILKNEAADVKDGLNRAGKAVSDELDRKQRELDAEPHERIDMILEENEAADERFRDLEERIERDFDGDGAGSDW